MRARSDTTGLVFRLTRGGAVLGALGLAVLAGASAGGAVTPGQKAKQKEQQAQAVLAQVAAIDRQVEHAAEQWDGARLRLRQEQAQLAVARRALGRARRQYSIAQSRVAARLVTLYTSPTPAPLDVVAGATSLVDLLDRVDAAKTIADQDARLAVEMRSARQAMTVRELRERQVVAAQAATVAALAANKHAIEGRLAQRKQLLSTIQAEVAVLQKQEAARQARLAAEARARLAKLRAEAEARAAAARRAAAERAAARKAAAEKAAAEKAAAEQARQQQTTTAPATDPATTKPAVAVDPAADPSATSATSPVLGGGHPDVAGIALNYLGYPYQWGGETPAGGFDCSGFVRFVYLQIGISLPHYTGSLWQLGAPVPHDQLQPGDLVFFYGEDHVGIYIGANQFVHAPHTGDVVKISTLDGGYFGAYVGARRIP